MSYESVLIATSVFLSFSLYSMESQLKQKPPCGKLAVNWAFSDRSGLHSMPNTFVSNERSLPEKEAQYLGVFDSTWDSYCGESVGRVLDL